MAMNIAIEISPELFEQAQQAADQEKRSIAGQVELWARLGRALLDLDSGTLTDGEKLSRIEDLEDALLVMERANGPFIEVSLDDL
jgi:hypothetical protein